MKKSQQPNAFNNVIVDGDDNDDKNNNFNACEVGVETISSISADGEVLSHRPAEDEGSSLNAMVSHDDLGDGAEDNTTKEELLVLDDKGAAKKKAPVAVSASTANINNNSNGKKQTSWQQSMNIPSLVDPADILGRINVGLKMADKMMANQTNYATEMNVFGKVFLLSGESSAGDAAVISSDEIRDEYVGDDDVGETASETPSPSEIDGEDGILVVEGGDRQWSSLLSTPPTNPLFSPSTDHLSTKTNLHGLGIRYSTDAIAVLSKAGEGRALLLADVSSLLDDLADSLSKSRTSMLLMSISYGGSNSTVPTAPTSPTVERFVREVNGCVASFIESIIALGRVFRADVIIPYRELCEVARSSSTKVYTTYIEGRFRCARTRAEALLSRRKYVDGIRELEGALKSLERAVRIARRKRGTGTPNLLGLGSRRKSCAVELSTSSALLSSQFTSSSDVKSLEGPPGGDGMTEQISTTSATDEAPLLSTSPPPWEDELRKLQEKYKLSRQLCDSVIRACDDVQMAQANYQARVVVENEAVEEVQSMERMTLDCLQRLEEERIVFLIGLMDRVLKDKKSLLEEMSLDLSPEALEPLDCPAEVNEIGKEQLSDGNAIIISTVKTVPSSLFMNTRLRTQSDDAPAINETRQVELPDNMAEIRERMKSLVKRQMNRLKTLKLIASFNEDMATAIEKFVSCLKSRLENGLTDKSMYGKDEAANVLSAWNSAVGSLEMYANNADLLAKQIRQGNKNLKSAISGFIEREAKSFQEREEYRWKALCDSARVEVKAKAKLKQHAADLEKAKARMSLAEEGETDTAGNNISPRRPARSVTKMDQQVNKAMGKMFSILPGGGEDVMNKVLTPMQRQSIATRQLDEAIIKEGKVSESYEIARVMKQQGVASYEAEAEGAEFKFKTDERNELDLMQKSLILNIKAMRKFRERQFKSIVSVVKGDLQGKGSWLDNGTGWVVSVEKLTRDHRARIVNDTKIDESIDQAEIGFSLKFQLVACPDVQDTIRKCLDENGTMDDMDLGGGEDATSGGDEDSCEISKVAPLLPDIPEDMIMKKMDSIFSKTLKNVSIDDYYSCGWSEDPPLYGPWLKKKGSYDLSISDWETSIDGGFENPWSKEKFPQKRVVQFKFKRTTHLYIGPPVAGVTQTQYLLKDGNDKCVVMMTVDIDGVPYADNFSVEVRWAARRMRDGIAIEAGVFVRILKASIFTNKIKSGVLNETPQVHLDLFEVIKKAIGSSDDSAVSEQELKKHDDSTKASTDIGETETANIKTSLNFEAIVLQIIATFSSLTPSQQVAMFVAASFVTLYFVGKGIFRNNSSRGTDDFGQRVDELSNEIREMKIILERILASIERTTDLRKEL